MLCGSRSGLQQRKPGRPGYRRDAEPIQQGALCFAADFSLHRQLREARNEAHWSLDVQITKFCFCGKKPIKYLELD